MNVTPRRAALSLLVTAGLVASLAGCTAGSTGSSDCAATPSGSVSNAVKVSGDFGTKPDVTINFPTAAPANERTVVINGDGDTVVAGDNVNVDYALFDGETGVELAATEYTEGSTVEFPVDDTQFLVGIVKTLECSTVGSRVVGVIPAADSFGEAGSDQLGVAPGDDIVFVVDVVSISKYPCVIERLREPLVVVEAVRYVVAEVRPEGQRLVQRATRQRRGPPTTLSSVAASSASFSRALSTRPSGK